jgi:hypothetical protein
MTRDHDTDRVLHAWLEEGADRAPERFVWAALDDVPHTPQRRAWMASLDALLQRVTPAARALGIAAVVVLAVVSYLRFGGADIGGPSGTPRVFTTDDLSSIVVWEDSAPPTWTLDSLITTSGEVLTIPVRTMTRSEFAALDEVRGYLGGRYTDFSGRDAVFMSWAVLFEDGAGADAALAIYMNELGSSDGWGLGPGQPAELGDEGTVFTGETRRLMADEPSGEPVPARIYLWRIGNLVLATGGWFEYDPRELRQVAEGMDARSR